jgi:pimeloyl-ACP methyl ester carboxylesterase
LSARLPRRYATLDEALARMKQENSHLSSDRAMHLTKHGTVRNEDGTWSWKYDNYVRSFIAMGLPGEQMEDSWNAIECPVWLVHGANSWAHHPEKDPRIANFRNARVTSYADAGHWVHHDRFETFLPDLREFLG